MRGLGHCLYCPADADSLEHIIPAAFGEFTNAPMLAKRVCETCNNRRLGLLDEQLARCGPEAFLRSLYAIKGREHHEKVNPFYRGSAGGHRIELTAWDPIWNTQVGLEIDGPKARQRREIIVKEASGRTLFLPIREDATPDKLREQFRGLGAVAPYEVGLSCGPEERGWVEPLIKQAWPECSFTERQLGSTLYENVVGQIGVTDRYFRALAKIGFHYFLTQFNEYTGHEDIFSSIRTFISEGAGGGITGINNLMGERKKPLLVEMLTPNARPDGWRAHLVCAESWAGECRAHVQIFLSEDWRAPIYTIKLANDPTAGRPRAVGHSFVYFEHGIKGRFSGEASPLQTLGTTHEPSVDPAVRPTTD